MSFLKALWAWIVRAWAFAASLPVWLTTVIVGFLGMIGATYFAWETVRTSWPADRLHDWIQSLSVEEMLDGKYNILVANLENDGDGRQSGHIAYSLNKGFSALGTPQPVAVQLALRELILAWSQGQAELRRAESEGLTWLEKFNGDVLIWGSVAEKGTRVLRLRFLSRQSAQSTPVKGYLVTNERLELDSNFDADFIDFLTANAVIAAKPAQGKYARLLKPQMQRLEGILPLRTLTDAQRVQIRETLAYGYSLLGEETGVKADLQRGVDEFRKVADHWRKQNDQVRWATTQDRLGNALMRLGQRENSSHSFEEAVQAYNEALKIHRRKEDPHKWGIIKNDLANALLMMGERDPSTNHTVEALTAYEEAIGALDSSIKVDWAMVQNNYGSALAIAGQREAENERLERAIKAFEEAQTAQTRDAQPVGWAQTATNLGAALAILAAREDNKERAARAVAGLRDAADAVQPDNARTQWAFTQHTLGYALLVQGAIEKEKKPFESAVGAFDKALLIRTRADASVQWATSKSARADAMTNLAHYERSPARASQAISDLNETLQVRLRDKLPSAWAESKRLLTEAHLELAVLTRSCDEVSRGKADGADALTVLGTERSMDRDRTTTALRSLDQLSAELQCATP